MPVFFIQAPTQNQYIIYDHVKTIHTIRAADTCELIINARERDVIAI